MNRFTAVLSCRFSSEEELLALSCIGRYASKDVSSVPKKNSFKFLSQNPADPHWSSLWLWKLPTLCVASFSNFCCVSDSLISFFRSKERQQFLAIFVTFLNLDYSGNWRDFRYTLLGYPMSVETLLPHFDVPFTPAPFSDKYILPKLTCKKTKLHCLLWQLILTIGLLMCSCTSLALLPVLLLKTALS